MKTFWKALRSQRGASLLEFALLMAFILPPLLLGAIEIGRYAYVSILVGNAARAGAAYGAQTSITAADGPFPPKATPEICGSTNTGITTAACKDFSFNGATLAISTGYACACDNGGTIGPPTYYASGACPVTCVAGQHEVVSLQVTACTSTLSNPPQPCGTFSQLFPGHRRLRRCASGSAQPARNRRKTLCQISSSV